MGKMSSIKINKIIETIFIIIFIIIIPLIYTRKTPDNQIVIRFILLSISLLFFLLLLYLKSIKNKKLLIKDYSFYFFLLLIIYTIISGIGLFYTVNLTDGIFSFSKIILFGILIILMFLNFDDPILLINKLTKAFTVLGFLIIIIGIYQLIDLSISESISHNNLYKITATFGHKNIFAQILLLCFPFSIYVLFERRFLWKLVSVFNILSIVILLTVLMTRSVWVAGVLAFIITSVIGIFTFKSNYINLKKLGLFIVPLIILILATAILYSEFDQSSAFKKQITKTFKFNYGSTKDRITLWEKSLELAKEKPLLGYGVGSWKINILKYGNQNLKSEDNLTFYQRPHNDFIWILCEQGIIALICYLSIFIISIYTAIKLLKSDIKKKIKIYVLLMIYALVSYLIFSFFSFPMDRIEFIVFISFIFASLISLSNNLIINKKSVIQIDTKYLAISISVILFLTILLGLNRLNSEIHLKKAYQARAKNDWNTLISEIDKSGKTIYKIDPFSTPLSWYRGLANFNLGNYTEACSDFNDAYKINPYHIHVLNNLATCKGIANEYDSALSLYKQALKIAPNFEDAIYNICGIYQKLNDIDNAISYLRKVKNPKNKARYNKVILILVKQKLYALAKINQEEKIKIYIQSLSEDNKKIIEIFHESVKNNYSIEQQVLINTQKE